MSDEVKTDDAEEPIGPKLNDRQLAFCREYTIDFRGTDAAVRAGYTDNRDAAGVHACRLLSKPRIRKEIGKYIEMRNKALSDSITIKIRPELKAAIVEMVGYDAVSRFVEQILIDNLGDDGLIKYIEKKARYVTSESKYSVLAKAGFKCQACGAKPLPGNDITLHIDHIIPFSMGGSSDESNLQVLCHECNISKGNKFAIDHRESQDE